jgi:hypothetical protein
MAVPVKSRNSKVIARKHIIARNIRKARSIKNRDLKLVRNDSTKLMFNA